MITVFERIPALFVELYDPEFKAWATDFRRRGPVQNIVLRSDARKFELNPDPAMGRVLHFVTLRAECRRHGDEDRMVVSPNSDVDAEKIARHVREMRGAVLN